MPLVLVVFAVAVLVGGCPKGTDTVEDVLMVDPPDTGAPDPADAPPADEPSTLAEAMASVTSPTSYELTISMQGHEVKQLVLLEDGKPVKLVVDHQHEQAGVVYADLVAKKMTTVDPTDGSTFEIPWSEDDTIADMLIGPDMLEQEVDILAVEDVDGVSCWVVETTAKGDEDTARVWIDREFGLVRQLEAEGERLSFKYSRINEVPASEFEPPAS